MTASPRAWLRRRSEAWFARRAPRQPGLLRLHRRRIYILPTRAGAFFGLLLLAMLLGALNYSNSLAFALTFLLAGLVLVAMHHTHGNLLNLSLRALKPAPVFAGGELRFPLLVENPSARARYVVIVDAGGGDAMVADIAAGGSAIMQLQMPARTRGRVPLPRVRLHSAYPLGLFRAWSWLWPEADALVYPRPLGAAPLPPLAAGDAEGDSGVHAGREDFGGLRRYARGDPPRLIHWKAYPRSGQLMVKQFTDPRERELRLGWAQTAGTTEQRLSQLTRWVLDADAAGLSYGLHLPGQEFPPATGGAQRSACLRALALFEAGRG